MKKNVKLIKVGYEQQKYIVSLLSDPVEPGDPNLDHLKAHYRADMLRNLVDTPELCYCGSAPFETLKMNWNGVQWVIELQAGIEDKPKGA